MAQGNTTDSDFTVHEGTCKQGVPDIVEPLYCGHLGGLVKCPVYSGTPLLWSPWGPGEVS